MRGDADLTFHPKIPEKKHKFSTFQFRFLGEALNGTWILITDMMPPLG